MTPVSPTPQDYFSTAVAWRIFSAMMVGNFLAILDFQIVASSINEMRAGMSASQDEIIWIQTVYIIGEVIAIALAAAFCKIFSTRIFFAISAVGFTIASLLCTIAWDLPSMLFARAIQGFFGGGMIPAAMATMFIVFPREKLALPLAIVGMVNTSAPTLGPILGGWITNHFSWHWLFIMNIIPGLYVVIAVLALPGTDTPNRHLLNKIDWVGMFSMALFLGTLMYVLDQGPRHDWLDDQSVALAFFVFLVASIIFFYRTFTDDEPVVDLSVFKDTSFTISTIIVFTVGIILYGLVYITPFFLGTVRGLNSLQIGEIMAVTGVSMFVTALLYGIFFGKLDNRYNIFFGLIIVSAGVWLNVNFTPETDFYELFWAQVLRGMGLIICMISISKAAMETLPRAKIRGASGIINLIRNVGGAIGFALINTLISYLFTMHETDIKSQLQWGSLDLALFNGNNIVPSDIDAEHLIALDTRISNIAISNSLNDLLMILVFFTLSVATLAIFLKNASKEQRGSESVKVNKTTIS
ncbi:MFS transporter, DHA2 family, multidrug resistance protein [Thalassolituus maritimus]|uniref:MFS transporter, DHA2 family, multidrug resistance protein n=1 Tax=Thalassolituus maritimus TaxID=484498 RepID=A0A1N7QA77_9GAMM|nr:DHA2 family efflux MFS transporter permease subunit [Thalassolituus maritimus]SIT19497.1 MFS transporter, DHA2 family, multidrug resistance protein [Thalassolituus maritimus]